MNRVMKQYWVRECTKKLTTAYVMKDCAMPIFFWVNGW